MGEGVEVVVGEAFVVFGGGSCWWVWWEEIVDAFGEVAGGVGRGKWLW